MVLDITVGVKGTLESDRGEVEVESVGGNDLFITQHDAVVTINLDEATELANLLWEVVDQQKRLLSSTGLE
jgi:hypothetical protein